MREVVLFAMLSLVSQLTVFKLKTIDVTCLTLSSQVKHNPTTDIQSNLSHKFICTKQVKDLSDSSLSPVTMIHPAHPLFKKVKVVFWKNMSLKKCHLRCNMLMTGFWRCWLVYLSTLNRARLAVPPISVFILSYVLALDDHHLWWQQHFQISTWWVCHHNQYEGHRMTQVVITCNYPISDDCVLSLVLFRITPTVSIGI